MKCEANQVRVKAGEEIGAIDQWIALAPLPLLHSSIAPMLYIFAGKKLLETQRKLEQ
jgi:hypothetical protein